LDFAGSELDKKIAACLFGELRRTVSAYSTDDKAADRALSYLADDGLSFELNEVDGVWYCYGRSKEKGHLLATGSAETRPLAVCRAILNLRRFGPSPVRREPTARSPRFHRRLELEKLRREAPRQCADCGDELRIQGRFTSNALCNKCRWKRGKSAMGAQVAIVPTL
jgi:hypothetical protein